MAGDANAATGLYLADGRYVPADAVLVAVPWRRGRGLFSAAMFAALPELAHAAEIPAAPITGVHLWFDRAITALPHAALIGRTSQWLFRHPRADAAGAASPHHYQVVISGAHDLPVRRKAEIVELVCNDLRSVLPAAAQAKLLGYRVITQCAAVFSPQPGVESLRPAQRTAVGNLFVAGDWTQTGWPATMEGAVRSGRLAAAAMGNSEFGSGGTPRTK